METEVIEAPRIDLDARCPLSTINRTAAARAMKINVSNVSRILSGQRTPYLHTFRGLADYLSLSMDQLYSLLYKLDEQHPS